MGKINTSLKQDFCKRYTTNIALNGKTGKIKGKEIMKNKESKNYDKAIFLGFFSFFFNMEQFTNLRVILSVHSHFSVCAAEVSTRVSF